MLIFRETFIGKKNLQTALTDTYCKLPMALTAENLAVKYNINRETVDKFALRSQQNWKKGSSADLCYFHHSIPYKFWFISGQDEGAFKAEIAPFTLKVKGKEVEFSVDEHPKWETLNYREKNSFLIFHLFNFLLQTKHNIRVSGKITASVQKRWRCHSRFGIGHLRWGRCCFISIRVCGIKT